MAVPPPLPPQRLRLEIAPPIQRIKEALAEIKTAARKEPVLAAAGAVLFLEKLAPAIEGVDSSSGAIGTAVNRAIETLVTISADARAAYNGFALIATVIPRSSRAKVGGGNVPQINEIFGLVRSAFFQVAV